VIRAGNLGERAREQALLEGPCQVACGFEQARVVDCQGGPAAQGPATAIPQPSIPATEVPQPTKSVTPAVPEAPVSPAVPDPGTPADPEEPATVPTPQEPATPIVPEPGPGEQPQTDPGES
jgi:hypothetical protein